MPTNNWCSKHGHYFGDDYCPICRASNDMDSFAKIAKENKEIKRELNVNTQKWIEEIQGIDTEKSRYDICPDCGNRSLEHITSLTKKCHNPNCKTNRPTSGAW